jgi:hypothetical protein
MHWRCRTGQIVNVIHLHFEGVNHIVPHQFEVGVIQQVSNVDFATGKKIIQANDFMPVLQQALA